MKWAVRVTRELVDSLDGEGLRAKQLCHGGLREACAATLALFPAYLSDRGQPPLLLFSFALPIRTGTPGHTVGSNVSFLLHQKGLQQDKFVPNTDLSNCSLRLNRFITNYANLTNKFVV